MAANKFSKTPPAAGEAKDAFVAAAPVASIAPSAALSAPQIQPAPQAAATPDDSVFRTLTLRLNKSRYQTLKLRATLHDRTIQDILTDALDEWLINNP